MQLKSRQAQIAENLRCLRTVFGYTQSDVAQAIHICRSTYVQYETGRKLPSTETMLALSHFYNISIDILLETGSRSFDSVLLHAGSAREARSRFLSVSCRLTEAQQKALLRMAKDLASQERTSL